MLRQTKTISFIVIGLICIFGFKTALAASSDFYVDKFYDVYGRNKITTTLIKTGNRGDFYVDTEYYEKLNLTDKNILLNNLSNLSAEFDNHIYPTITQAYTYYGILQNNVKLNIVIHPITSTSQGYTRSIDFYPTSIFSDSNNTPTIYLSLSFLTDKTHTNLQIATILAHEFTHWITIETKGIRYTSSDDTWLNEARAEYSETLLDYPNLDWQNSLLSKRLNVFIYSDSINFLNWQNSDSNYAAINLFTQYLVDHYGMKVLTDTLKNQYQGITSLNASLVANGYTQTFNDIYNDWAIANVINDCAVGQKYCYNNNNLGEFIVSPQRYYLPSTGNSSLTVNINLNQNEIKYQSIVGGHDSMVLTFEKPATEGLNRITYVLAKADQSEEVKTLDLTGKKTVTLTIPDFGKTNVYVTLIFNRTNESLNYNIIWRAAVNTPEDQKQTDLIASLLKQIDALKQQLAYLMAMRAMSNPSASSGQVTTTTLPVATCGKFNKDLKYGMTNNDDVRCLQKFLASQPGIYPLGLISGNYLTYTELAVSDFQDESGITPTGYFGPLTRAKVNGMRGF